MVLLGPGPVQDAQPNYTDWPFPWTLLKLILWIADEKHSDFISQFHFKFFLLQSVMFGFQLPWNCSSALVRIVSSGKMIFHLFQRSFKMSQVDMENPDVFNSENWETDFEPCLVCILRKMDSRTFPSSLPGCHLYKNMSGNSFGTSVQSFRKILKKSEENQ